MKKLLVILLLSISVVYCNAPISVVTPQGHIAYTADQIVVRVNELQNAAIQANSTNGLDNNTTRIIVEFAVSADTILKTTPTGWQASLSTAWNTAKVKLIGVKNPSVLTAINLVDAVILTLTP